MDSNIQNDLSVLLLKMSPNLTPIEFNEKLLDDDKKAIFSKYFGNFFSTFCVITNTYMLVKDRFLDEDRTSLFSMLNAFADEADHLMYDGISKSDKLYDILCGINNRKLTFKVLQLLAKLSKDKSCKSEMELYEELKQSFVNNKAEVFECLIENNLLDVPASVFYEVILAFEIELPKCIEKLTNTRSFAFYDFYEIIHVITVFVSRIHLCSEESDFIIDIPTWSNDIFNYVVNIKQKFSFCSSADDYLNVFVDNIQEFILLKYVFDYYMLNNLLVIDWQKSIIDQETYDRIYFLKNEGKKVCDIYFPYPSDVLEAFKNGFYHTFCKYKEGRKCKKTEKLSSKITSSHKPFKNSQGYSEAIIRFFFENLHGLFEDEDLFVHYFCDNIKKDNVVYGDLKCNGTSEDASLFIRYYYGYSPEDPDKKCYVPKGMWKLASEVLLFDGSINKYEESSLNKSLAKILEADPPYKEYIEDSFNRIRHRY